MAKKKQECESEDGAWEMALADLMTVLMVFFLVMWLTSIIEPEQRKAFVQSVLGEGGGLDQVIATDGDSPIEVEKIKIAKHKKAALSKEDVQEVLKEIKPKDFDIEEVAEGIKITLRSDSFFESGRANIREKTLIEIEKLAETIIGRQQEIVISGYTDNISISNFQFPSNWELSAARAATVARTFIKMGIEQDLLTIKGFSSNNPIESNDTRYGRSLNRRVVILVKEDLKIPLDD